MRLTDDRDDPHARRARSRRRALVAVFLGAVTIALFALLYAGQRMAAKYPAEDPAAWIEAADADAVWRFRVEPMAEWLERSRTAGSDEGAMRDIRAVGRALHAEGVLFIYRPARAQDSEWFATLSIRRPLKVYHDPLDALARELTSESQEIAVIRDGRRILVGNCPKRMEAFRAAVQPREAAEAPPAGPALSFGGEVGLFSPEWRSAIADSMDSLRPLLEAEGTEMGLLWPSPEPGPLCSMTILLPPGFPAEDARRVAQQTGAALAEREDGRLVLSLMAANVPPIWNESEPVLPARDAEKGGSP